MQPTCTHLTLLFLHTSRIFTETFVFSKQIKDLEKDVDNYKTQIKNTCGDKDYTAMKNDINESIEEAKRFADIRKRITMLSKKVESFIDVFSVYTVFCIVVSALN